MDPAACRLCLVTDDALLRGRDLGAVVAAAVAGGVTMVQVREKARSTRDFLADVVALKARLAPLGIPLIVNDRVDVALAAGADGVHVGQDDMPVAAVRRLVGPRLLIGLSVTSLAEARRSDADLADYLGVGPVYDQATKPDAAPSLGLAGLAAIRAHTARPLLAIGGINARTGGEVMRGGADGLAVVSAILAAPDPERAARDLRHVTGP